VVGCIPRWFTCQQTVTHPSSNWARCRATLLIKTNMLTTTPRRHPCVDYNSSTCDTSVDMQQNNYQNITINFLEIPQGSQQATKVKFPDISLTLQAGFTSFLAKICFQVKTEIHKNNNTQRNTSAHNYSTRMQLKYTQTYRLDHKNKPAQLVLIFAITLSTAS